MAKIEPDVMYNGLFQWKSFRETAISKRKITVLLKIERCVSSFCDKTIV